MCVAMHVHASQQDAYYRIARIALVERVKFIHILATSFKSSGCSLPKVILLYFFGGGGGGGGGGHSFF